MPDGLRDLIGNCVPNIDAAELLLLLAQQPERTFDVGELIGALRPADVTEPAARKYLAAFEACDLIVQEHGRYHFAPVRAKSHMMIRALAKLYNERPVTLVRMIYALRGESIRAFADAFSLKKP